MKQPLLIFGKTGQVATELQSLCRQLDRPCIVIDRTQVDLASLADEKTVADQIARHDPIAILNAAAHTAVDQAESEPDLAQAINARAPGIIAAACKTADIPLVHVSTDFVFDGAATTPYTETAQPNPLSVYGQTKRAGEMAISASGCTHAIVRTAWVFSPYGKNFVKTMLRLGAERETLTVVADQIGCPTPARAIAAAMITIADTLTEHPQKSGIYHLCGDEQTSWAGLARATISAAHLKTRIEDIPSTQYPTPATRPAYSVLDCTKLKATFGIDAPDWRAAVDDTVRSILSAQ